MKTLLFLIVLLAQVAYTVYGAAEGEGGEGDTTPAEIDVVALYGSDQEVDRAGFDGRGFTTWLEDRTGIHINWHMMSRARESIYSLIASNALQDLLVAEGELGKREVMDLAEQEHIVPLNSLIEEHAPDIFNALDSVEGRVYRSRLTLPDGKMYSFPYIHVCFPCQFPLRMWIYKPWAEMLNLDWPPETPEDYKVILTGMKHGDGNANGKNDEIPLIGIMSDKGYDWDPTGFLMSAFVRVQSPVFSPSAPYLVREGIEVSFNANTDAWRAGIGFLRDLYRDGLLYENSFSLTREKMKSLVDSSGDERSVGSFASGWYVVAEFEAIGPLEGTSGERHATFRPPGLWFSAHITTESEERAEVIAGLVNWWFVDPVEANYLCSNFWQENEHWKRLTLEEKRKGFVAIDGLPAESVWIGQLYSDEPRAEGWGDSCFARWRSKSAMVEPSSSEWRLILDTGELYAPYASQTFIPPDLYVSPEETAESAELRERIVTVVQETAVEFITGKRDIDDDGEWEEYLEELEKMGVSRYVEIWQSVIGRNEDSVRVWTPFIEQLRTVGSRD